MQAQARGKQEPANPLDLSLSDEIKLALAWVLTLEIQRGSALLRDVLTPYPEAW